MASYSKLKSGKWGVRSTLPIASGDTITVTKKDGSTKVEVVDKIVWSGDGVWLAAIVKQDAPPSQANFRRDPDGPGRNGMMPGCGGCRAIGRMCKQCAFDEYDM